MERNEVKTKPKQISRRQMMAISFKYLKIAGIREAINRKLLPRVGSARRKLLE